MSLEQIRNKLGKSLPKSQWEQLVPNRRRHLNDELVFLRFSEGRNKKNVLNYHLQINIGDKVASLFNWTHQTKVKVFLDRSNTNLFLLKVSQDDIGYQLTKAKRSVVFNFTCSIPFPVNLPKNTTVPVFFDIESDDSLLLDISKSTT